MGVRGVWPSNPSSPLSMVCKTVRFSMSDRRFRDLAIEFLKSVNQWPTKWGISGHGIKDKSIRKLVRKLLKQPKYKEYCPRFSTTLPHWDPTPFDADHFKTEAQIASFYESWGWKRARYDFIKDKQRRCQCCGATPENGVRIVVDHIHPIRKFWSRRLDPSNFQILCDDCNMGKGSRDQTDWR